MYPNIPDDPYRTAHDEDDGILLHDERDADADYEARRDAEPLIYPGSLMADLEALKESAQTVAALEPSKAKRDAMSQFSTIFGDGKEIKAERFAGYDRNSSDGYGSWRQ